MIAELIPPKLAATAWFVLTGMRTTTTGISNWHRIDHGACYYRKQDGRRSMMVVARCGSERPYGGSRREIAEPPGDHCPMCDHLYRVEHTRERAEVMA